MIGRGVITKLADAAGVDAQTVERDYVISHVIEAIGSTCDETRFVFKGGTALRLIHFQDYRFSADLVFSSVDGLSVSASKEIVAEALKSVIDRIELPRLELGADAFLRYVGPLGREHNIKLDISGEELVSDGGSKCFSIISRYDDQLGGTIRAYTVEEVAAEKLRCVIQRVQARDLFDLFQLFGVRGVDIELVWPTFEVKARHKGLDPNLFLERFEDRMIRWRRLWEAEMNDHVPPGSQLHLKEVERAVRREIRRVCK